MTLPIETWINERGYKKNVKKLFNESIICYKNNAYRASLLFSYLGFLTIVKETIIQGKRPDAISESRWDKILKDIENDDKWEAAVFDEVMNSKAPIFNITEDIRDQIKYWKNRRNDCAHFKKNEIEGHHVESFWSFLRSNISRITLEGGLDSLVRKFAIHFDETYTPPDKSFDYLIKEISSSVYPAEHVEFFQDLRLALDGRYFHNNRQSHKVFNRIIEIGDSLVRESLIDHLKKSENDRDIKFLDNFPDKITFFEYTSAEIRSMWKTRFYIDGINPFNILTSLFRNNIIPEDEIDEVNRSVFELYNQQNKRFLPSRDHIDTLKANGFIEMIYTIAFEEKDLHNYIYVNSKCDLIMVFIVNAKLKTETVKKICEMAGRANYSQWLIREISDFMDSDDVFKDSFYDIASKAKIKIPGLIS